MRPDALLLAATAALALAQAASAQTVASPTAPTTNTTASTSVQTPMAVPGAPVNPPPASVGTAPPAPAAAYRPITPAPGADIVAVLQASGQFTTLLKVADATSLTQVLKTTPSLTLIAPTDTAFAALPPAALDLKDPANLQKLQALLTYHLINAKVPPVKGHAATAIQTVAAGKKVTIDGSGDTVKINDAAALQPEVTASNGVIFPIDKVLSPDYVAPPAPAAEPVAAEEPKTTTTKSTTKSKKKKR